MLKKLQAHLVYVSQVQSQLLHSNVAHIIHRETRPQVGLTQVEWDIPIMKHGYVCHIKCLGDTLLVWEVHHIYFVVDVSKDLMRPALFGL